MPNKQYFDGAKTYKVTLPKDIPEANFWSFTVYDNMTRSMLDTPQRYPRAGSQSYPVARRRSRTPTARRRCTSVRTSLPGVKRGNWIQTDARQGLVHDPAPLQPARALLRQELAAERDRVGSVSDVRDRVPIPVGQFKLGKGKIVLAGATKDALKAMPKFEYAK